MTKIRTRKSIAKVLRDLRQSHGMPVEVVVEELKELKVVCSFSNLAKIERNEVVCRADILAGLCLIYEVDIKDIIYT